VTADGPPPKHVDLQRRFEASDGEYDPWARQRGEVHDWTWLLSHHAVALLAEAGSGKTHELRQLVPDKTTDRAIFLMRIDRLAENPFEESHDSEEQRARFGRWLSSDADGIFLLDAVDEAKLPHGDRRAPLRDALARVRHAIGDNLHRVRLVVTCRSSEWHDQSEREPFDDLAAAMAEARRRSGRLDEDSQVLELSFVPLTVDAIERLGRSRGTDDGFLDALRESGALDHAITPLDVIHYADAYVTHRDRGGPGLPRTRRELLSASIERRLAEEGATWTRSRLRRDEARAGAALLCFALTMAQKRELSIEGDTAGVHAAAVLATADPPWRAEQVRELLSTALFAPAAAGLVRPYRPEVAAMLAAEHLDGLIAKGVSEQRVIDDFVRPSFGRSVIARAHRGMLAWLASTRPAVLRRLVEVAPEHLIEDGDPRALAVPDRVAALERHIAGVNSLPGGFFFQQEDLRRFATPDLEADVLRLLYVTPSGEGRIHLLQIIRAGRYAAAGAQLVQLASDPFTPIGVRSYAMSALVAAASPAQLAQCAQALLAWGVPIYSGEKTRRAREIEDESRHRLVRHGYPAAFNASVALRLLGQIAGKQWSSNAKSLAAGMERAPAADLEQLVVGLDRLCFPLGDVAGSVRAPHMSTRLPDLFRSLVTLVGRAIDECVEFYPLLVPIHVRCVRSLQYDRGQGYMPRERPDALFKLPSSFRLAILDAYAAAGDPTPPYRPLELVLPSVAHGEIDYIAEAEILLARYVGADEPGRRIYAEVLEIWTRRMPRLDRWRWRRALRHAARHHRAGADARTLGDVHLPGPRSLFNPYRRLRSELPWKAEDAWIRLRHAAVERWSLASATIRHFSKLADGRAAGLLYEHLHVQGSGDILLQDPATARRRPLGSRLVPGAIAHARRHDPTGFSGGYEFRDILAFAGWAYLWGDDHDAFVRLPDAEMRRAIGVALTSPLEWPVWAAELAAIRPDLFRAEAVTRVADEVFEFALANPQVTPPVLGKLAELGMDRRADVAPDLMTLAAANWRPGSAAIRALRTIADADPGLLARLRVVARRRAREAIWEGMPLPYTLWLALWAAEDPAAIEELLALRQGPLAGEMGCVALVRTLEPLVGRGDDAEDRLAPPSAEILLRLAEHVFTCFPPEEDDHREGMRVRDDRRRGEDVRAALLNMLGERRDPEGRAVLEAFVETHIRPRDPRWADAWLGGHAQDAAEPAPWTIQESAFYGSAAVRRPETADDLLAAVMQGLRDIERDLDTSEFDRRALFRDASETDVRAFLGHELDQRHREQYSVTQESETARAKRPDLRCALRAGGPWVAVVEIKLVHRWTWTVLLEKLVTQLLEQYLISDRVARGVYLLVDMGRLPIGTPPDGIETIEDLMSELRTIVRTDPRFADRPTEIMRLRIAMPPKQTRPRKKKSSQT